MSDAIARVHYFERQFLRAQDFTDEQAYHLAMRRRHNRAQHIWGIVRGLELLVENEGRGLFVAPGMAIDAFGRELIVTRKLPLTNAFLDQRRDALDVWLLYGRAGSDQAQSGYAGCGDEAGATAYYRWQEQPIIRLTEAEPEPTDRRAGEETDPTLAPPDDPQQQAKVFLGQVRRDPTQGVFSVDLADRPYAGLVGQRVVEPTGHAALELGPSGDFAVLVRADEPGAQPETRLAVSAAGGTAIHGDATVWGNLKISAGAVEFGVLDTAPAQPRRWQIYRATDGTTQVNELRLEIGEGADANRFVVGHWSEKEKTFHPCLSVEDDCTVRIHGNLIVDGTVDPPFAVGGVVTPRLDDGTKSVATSMFASSIVSANLPTFAVMPPALGIKVVEAHPPLVVQPQAVAQRLEDNPSEIAILAAHLKSEHPDVAAALHDALKTTWG